MGPIEIKQGDVGHGLDMQFWIDESAGTPMSLSGKTVRVFALEVDGSTVNERLTSFTVTDAATGKGTYTTTTADAATKGHVHLEFKIDDGTNIATIPSGGTIHLLITSALQVGLPA